MSWTSTLARTFDAGGDVASMISHGSQKYHIVLVSEYTTLSNVLINKLKYLFKKGLSIIESRDLNTTIKTSPKTQVVYGELRIRGWFIHRWKQHNIQCYGICNGNFHRVSSRMPWTTKWNMSSQQRCKHH